MELSTLILKNFLYLLKKSFPYISGNRTFQEIELSSSKIKKLLIFPAMEPSSPIFFFYLRTEPFELKK